MPSTSTSGPPIMKSVCTRRLVDAGLLLRVLLEVERALDAVRDAAAVRDVARRVLVEERVEEDVPDLPDARAAVDERDLAELRGAVVRRELRANVVRSGRRLDVDDRGRP